MLILYIHLIVINVCVFLAFSYVSYISSKDSTIGNFKDTLAELTSFKSLGAVISWQDSSVLMSAVAFYATFSPMMGNVDEGKLEISSGDDPRTYYQLTDSNLIGELFFVSNCACNFKSLLDDLSEKFSKDILKDKIVLNERGGCSFYDKVKNFQKIPGVKAVIIGNNLPGKNLLVMKSDNILEKVVIPSFFITKESFDELKQIVIMQNTETLNVHIRNAKITLPYLEYFRPLYLPSVLVLMIVLAVIVSICKFRPNTLDAVYIYKRNILIPRKIRYSGIQDKIVQNNKNLQKIKTSFKYLCRIFKQTDADYVELGDSSTSLQAGTDNDSEISSNMSLTSEVNSTQTVFNKTISTMVHNFKSFTGSEVPNKFRTKRCAICLEKFHRLKSFVTLLECNHVFHYDCCSRWLQMNYCCPICQSIVVHEY